MGGVMAKHRSKTEQLEVEESWDRLADAKGYNCKQCGSRIPYSERDLYFETGYCSLCYNSTWKDD